MPRTHRPDGIHPMSTTRTILAGALVAAVAMACADATDLTASDGAPPDQRLGDTLPDFYLPPPADERDAAPEPEPEEGCDPSALPPTLADAPRCRDHSDCQPGYQCREVANFGPDTTFVCLPPACIDRDHDGYGIGDDCQGPDCDDCDPAVHPGAPERCNGRDDDCNGALDDDLDPADAPLDDCEGLGVCVDAEQRCLSGAWICDRPPTYEAAETLCDGLDNDCNGRVDDIPGRGDPCTVGEGPCAQDGVMICDGLGGGLVCGAEPLPPVDEICNGLDDDCDGVVDDVPGAGERCTVESGACTAQGERQCDPVIGRLVCNAPPPVPMDEICDNRDNDCDGEIDEDTPPACVPGVEACNNIDDNGDGRIDEDLTQPCDGACGEGTERCIAGRWQGCDAPNGEPEVCNGRDDDCDGMTDEQLQNACGGCGDVIEQCDNQRDDDCDGAVDELCPVRPCEGQADGAALGPCERWSLCGGFDDICDSTGTEQWRCPICEGGEPGHRIEERGCVEDTEGVGCEVDGHAGTCRGDRCQCDRRFRSSCDGAVRVEDDSCGTVRRTACPYGCRDGECIDCQPDWSAPACDGNTVVSNDGCGNQRRTPCGANERCQAGACVPDCRVSRSCVAEDVWDVDSCAGPRTKVEECNGVRGLPDDRDMCNLGQCCHECVLAESRWPRPDERVPHDNPDFPNDGRAMRLSLDSINPSNTCGDIDLVLTKADGSAFGAGRYHLRNGACLPIAEVRAGAPYTIDLRGGERTVPLRGIDFRVNAAFPDPGFEVFCVTKDDGDHVAWWHSNLLIFDRDAVPCR